MYDRARQKIHGYRLPVPGAGRYQRISPQLGHYHSNVLDVDLTILDNNLHFLVGEAELPGSADLIHRLQGLLVNVEAKAEQAQAQAEQAQEQAAARALLTVVRIRGIDVPDAERDRILAEKDLKRLERWPEKAVVAASFADVLDDPR